MTTAIKRLGENWFVEKLTSSNAFKPLTTMLGLNRSISKGNESS